MRERRWRITTRGWRWGIIGGGFGIVWNLLYDHPGSAVTAAVLLVLALVGLRTDGAPRRQRQALLIVTGVFAAWNAVRLGHGIVYDSGLGLFLGVSGLGFAALMAWWIVRVTAEGPDAQGLAEPP